MEESLHKLSESERQPKQKRAAHEAFGEVRGRRRRSRRALRCPARVVTPRSPWFLTGGAGEKRALDGG